MSNKLNDSLGNWEQSASEVKTKIYEKTIHNQQKTSKRLYIKPLLVAATLFVFTAGAVLLNLDLFKSDEPQQLKPVDFPMYDENTVQITKYELFYRDPSFFTKELADYFSLNNTIEKYALFYHLQKFDYKLDEERIDTLRRLAQMAMEYDMKDEKLKAYYERMFTELGITEEDYIEDYLLINKEYDVLFKEMNDKNIGLNEDREYEYWAAIDEYEKLVGIPDNYLNDLEKKDPEPLEPLNPQPKLPFNTEDFDLKVTTNEQGDYIFVKSVHFYFFISQTQRDFLSDLYHDIVKEDLTRYSFERYKEAIKSYKSDDAEKMKTAKEVSSILEVLERTIDMEMTF